jgi:hypothetical protein
MAKRQRSIPDRSQGVPPYREDIRDAAPLRLAGTSDAGSVT